VPCPRYNHPCRSLQYSRRNAPGKMKWVSTLLSHSILTLRHSISILSLHRSATTPLPSKPPSRQLLHLCSLRHHYENVSSRVLGCGRPLLRPKARLVPFVIPDCTNKLCVETKSAELDIEHSTMCGGGSHICSEGVKRPREGSEGTKNGTVITGKGEQRRQCCSLYPTNSCIPRVLPGSCYIPTTGDSVTVLKCPKGGSVIIKATSQGTSSFSVVKNLVGNGPSAGYRSKAWKPVSILWDFC
jgi:hypothetical protein